MPGFSTLVPRMTALAPVFFNCGAYFGLERKVICPGPACSMPATPDISTPLSPSSVQSSFAAMSAYLICVHLRVSAVALSPAEQADLFLRSRNFLLARWCGSRADYAQHGEI